MAQQITNLSNITELEAVNAMLSAIGEAPISTLVGATQADVVTAINILRNTTREVQTLGWRFNTDFGYEIRPYDSYESTDSTGVITTLKVFVPPPRLAAFEMSMGPTQQGDVYPDAVLRAPRCYAAVTAAPPPVAKLWWEITGEQKVTFYANYNGVAGNFLSTYTTPASFHWDFGDGTSQTTSVPSVVHQYPFGHFLDIYMVPPGAGTTGWHANLLRRYTASLCIEDAGGVSAVVTPGTSYGPSVLDRQMNPQVSPQSDGTAANHLGGATRMVLTAVGSTTVVYTMSESVGQSVSGGAVPVAMTSEIIDFGNTTAGAFNFDTSTPSTPVGSRWGVGGKGTDSAAPNNTWANRKVILRAQGGLGGSLRGTTLDGPNNAGVYAANTQRDIWYEWTAPTSGTATFSTVQTPYGPLTATMLGIYTGASLAGLALIAFNDKGGTFGKTDLAIVSFAAVMGTTYHIQVGCGYDQQGTVTMTWSLV